MKGRQLLDAMAYIDDALIEEAALLPENEQTDMNGFNTPQRYNWKNITVCAAVFVVAVVSLWLWKSGIVSQKRTVLDKGQNSGGVSSVYEVDTVKEENASEEISIADFKENMINDAVALDAGDVSDASISTGIVAETKAVTEPNNSKDRATDNFAEESKSSIVKVIEEYNLPSVYCYASPEKGKCLICAELRAAIDYYDYADNTIDITEPDSYLYHVEIQIFGETDCDEGSNNEQTGWQGLWFSEEGKEKLYQEYERILSAGLDVNISEDYVLTGLLNHEEIENFIPNPDYGYAFRLINEN